MTLQQFYVGLCKLYRKPSSLHRCSCAVLRNAWLTVVDVVLPVTMQRQALAVLFVLTVEVPQIQFFDVVGFRFLGMWVYIDKSLLCQWSCKGRFQLLSVCYENLGKFPRISTRSLALSALGPWTLLLRSFVCGRHLPRCPRVSVRLLLERMSLSTSRMRPSRSHLKFGHYFLGFSYLGTLFAQYLVRQWTYVPGLFSLAFGRICGIFSVMGSSDLAVDSRAALLGICASYSMEKCAQSML